MTLPTTPNTRRWIIWAIGIPVTLFLPGLIAVPVHNSLSTRHLSRSYLGESGFSYDQFRAHPAIDFIPTQSQTTDQLNRIAFVDTGGRFVSLLLLKPFMSEQEVLQDVFITLSDVTSAKRTSTTTDDYSISALYDDGSICEARLFGYWIYFIRAPRKINALKLLASYGILEVSPVGIVRIMENHPFIVVFAIIGFGLLFFLAWILGGGRIVMALRPADGLPIVSRQQILEIIRRLGTFQFPYPLEEVSPGTFKYSCHTTYQQTSSHHSLSIEEVHRLTIRVHPHKPIVMSAEYRQSRMKGGSLLKRFAQFQFSKVITFQYDKRTIFPVIFRNGTFEMTGKAFGNGIRDIRNPLVEAVVCSGWTWQPVYSL